jgi:hypothetical protein
MAIGVMSAGVLLTVFFDKLMDNLSMYSHLMNIVSARANVEEANAVTSKQEARNLIW